MSAGSGVGGGASAVELTDPAAVRTDALAGGRAGGLEGKSPTQIALRRLRRDPVAMSALAVVIFFVLVAIFAPLLARLEGQTPDELHQELLSTDLETFGRATFTASADHWFGVEPRLGRDLFARWVYGARPSLVIATTAAVMATIIGTALGLLAGFLGGWVDRVISWVIDFLLSLPFLLFAIALVPIVTARFGTVEEVSQETVSNVRFVVLIVVLVMFGWLGLARLIRGEVISLREREFVQAARALGVPTRQILFREMLPNLLGPIIVSLSLAIPAFVAAEAGLSFLGVGLTEPTPSWGQTIAAATNYFATQPLYLWLPALGVSLLVLSLSLLGDAIRDAFDPHTRR